MAQLVTVAALQTAFTDEIATNVARVTALVREAASRGAQIILPSELFESHYFCRLQREEDFARARPVDGHPTLRVFAELAAELGVVIPVSFFERSGPEYYNSIAVIDADGTNLGIYRKSHIPDGPGYQEKFYFKPGNTGFGSFATMHGTIGVGICWDQWFPEAARLTALAGADLLLYPTAIGGIPSDSRKDHVQQADAWETMQRAHAVANGVFVVAVNRVGLENGVRFWGGSFVCDPLGVVIARAGRDRDEVLVVDCDLTRVEYARQHWPFLRDRRIDSYIGIIRRWGE